MYVRVIQNISDVLYGQDGEAYHVFDRISDLKEAELEQYFEY